MDENTQADFFLADAQLDPWAHGISIGFRQTGELNLSSQIEHSSSWVPRTLLHALILIVVGAGFSALALQASAQQFDPNLYSNLRWRLVGPFRGGRANAATGVPGQPNTFYFGSVGGGVWKSQNAGRTWQPIFDAMPVGSIGAIAVAPSNPDVVYVGTGEADMRSQISFGNGMYKSTDAGKTWTHVGLENTRQIGRIVVDPGNPDIVFVAALGHAYGPNPDRGVYRSTDGGTTWQKILYKGESVGAIDLAIHPQYPRTIYASVWNTRRPPWGVYTPSYGPGSGVFKSSDGGDTWQQLAGGLPTERVGRIGLAIAPTNPKLVYAIVDAKDGGLYRSDDAGATWSRSSGDERIWGRGWYFGNVAVDSKDPETLYVSNTSLYRSSDGGKTWTPIKGAPGGDDYHQLWIDPDDPKRMIVASDQGTVVSVDGAATWSSWYNQPTAQMYHVSPDYRFPYWVSGAQQDSGAIGVPTRSNHSQISIADWSGMCAGGESGYLAPDPLHPEILFGGTVTRCNLITGEVRNVSPELGRTGPFRRVWTLPLVFSEADPHALYFGAQFLFKTVNGGESWTQISPDLTREDPGVPPNLDEATGADAPTEKRRGVIYTIAPSPIPSHGGTIWIGTDDGYIQVTIDGGAEWRNVTPHELTPWSKVVMMQASHFDANEAFAAVDRHRLEDNEPYIYRTRDGGKTWQSITAGLPAGVYLQTVKEDPHRRGLLFAGTELGIYVSFDDGDHWQSLQLNLPPVSMRDLAIRGNDLIVATHGRSFWILDDISVLRQLNERIVVSSAFLFRPADAIRMHAGSDDGTPLPRDEAFAENPPAGAVIEYYLGPTTAGPVALEILDAEGKLVRRYSSEDRAAPADPNNLKVQAFWHQPQAPLPAVAGAHRWIWDLQYTPVPENTEGGGFFLGGGGLTVLPGRYTVRLTAGGRSYRQPLAVVMDPRIKVPLAELQKQFETGTAVARERAAINAARREVAQVRAQIEKLRTAASGNSTILAALEELERKAQSIGGVPPAHSIVVNLWESPSERTSFLYLSGEFARIAGAVNRGDAGPTAEALKALAAAKATLTATQAKWSAVKSSDLPAINAQFKKAGFAPIEIGRDGPEAPEASDK